MSAADQCDSRGLEQVKYTLDMSTPTTLQDEAEHNGLTRLTAPVGTPRNPDEYKNPFTALKNADDESAIKGMTKNKRW